MANKRLIHNTWQKLSKIDAKIERYLSDINIIREPHFKECYDDIFNKIEVLGKDPHELLDEYKKAAETDPKFDIYKLIALCKYGEDIRLKPKETGSGRGGRREGAGRKKGQRIKEDFELKKARSIRMTDEEYPQVLEYLKQLRAKKKAEGKDAKSNQDNN